MGPPSFMRSVVDGNVSMRRMAVPGCGGGAAAAADDDDDNDDDHNDDIKSKFC